MNNTNFQLYDQIITSEYGVPSALVVGKISDSLLQDINQAIGSGDIPVTNLERVEDRFADHLLLKCDIHSRDIDEKLNKNLAVYSIHKRTYEDALIRRLHDEIRSRFASEVKSPFVIVNTRMWATLPSSERFGPNDMHLDGFAAGHLKCMIYLQPLDEEHGHLVVRSKGGDLKVSNLPAGTAIMFRNSDILHSGVPGTIYPRAVIEVTLMRSIEDGDQYWPGHFYGRHLESPLCASRLKASCEIPPQISLSRYYFKHTHLMPKLNVGSGRRNWGDGWFCLDEIEHDCVTNIIFDQNTKFPFQDRFFSMTYSSHCFEHLADDVLDRVVREIKRVTCVDGLFLLKIPNYDWFLEQYSIDNRLCMNGKGVESILWTWKDSIEDSFLNRLAMMFCGYWNKGYGDHFKGLVNKSSDAYHGPPRVEPEKLRAIFSSNSPRKIASELRDLALTDPDFFRFNHQNAWSREEIIKYIEPFGFNTLCSDADLIKQKFRQTVPDLDSMADWSQYILFQSAPPRE